MQPNAKTILKIGGFALFFILIVLYGFLRSKDLLFGVKIKNVNLQDGATMAESIIDVSGNAKNAIRLSLDGREISIDQKGNFNETIALNQGYNIIEIEAQDKFGFVDKKAYKLMLK
jgi:hypothetical protein